jgi:hypothetical protein
VLVAVTGSARYFYGLNTYSGILLQKSLFLCHSSVMVQHLTIIFREMLYNHGNFFYLRQRNSEKPLKNLIFVQV